MLIVLILFIFLELYGRLSVSLSVKKCPACPYSTTVLGNLKRHLLRHSGDRPFKCTLCSRQLKQHLQNHMSIHTGFRFSCEICGKKFTRLSSVRHHKFFKHCNWFIDMYLIFMIYWCASANCDRLFLFPKRYVH